MIVLDKSVISLRGSSSGLMSIPFEEPEFKIVKKERRHYMQYHEPREDIHEEVVKDEGRGVKLWCSLIITHVL